mmetsp:Transcript_9288/g.29533  ORF Transcript_9288/g.29533 Transcript_9288/m.29533 type:complete len:116 (-) Transcript_9288:339-686(-)
MEHRGCIAHRLFGVTGLACRLGVLSACVVAAGPGTNFEKVDSLTAEETVVACAHALFPCSCYLIAWAMLILRQHYYLVFSGVSITVGMILASKTLREEARHAGGERVPRQCKCRA